MDVFSALNSIDLNAFIIGAGFTRAVFPSSPLNSELLDKLAKLRPDDSAASALRDRYKTDDIEIALTRLDCDIAQSSPEPLRDESRGLRGSIEKELGDYFSSSLFCASEKLIAESPWLASFIDHAFTPGDTVISLNYDCVLEGALDYRGKWTPNGGYGSFLNHPFLQESYSQSSVTIVKIHGSASFRSPLYRNKPGTGSLGFVINEHFFPRSAKNLSLGLSGDEGPYLIAPSYVKVPRVEIAYLMLDALAELAKADNLVIIGSALRKEDSFLTLIITRFLHHPCWKTRKIIIVDPCADVIREKLKSYWGSRLSDQIVSISERLQDSVKALVKLISTSPER
jgi:hypothetical protein